MDSPRPGQLSRRMKPRYRLLIGGTLALAVHLALLLIQLPQSVDSNGRFHQIRFALAPAGAPASEVEAVALAGARPAQPTPPDPGPATRPVSPETGPPPPAPQLATRPTQPTTETAATQPASVVDNSPESISSVTAAVDGKIRPAPPTKTPAVATGEIGETPGATHATFDSDRANRATRAVELALAKHFRYPMLARKKGWQGEVLIGLVIQPDGGVRNIQLLRSSGFGLLDRSAINTVAKIAARGGVNPNLVLQPLEITLPVSYQLTS
ncbi:MAG: TonB family protein [Gammaproteobacteria bacterium]|nr:TonB family protein [Gammaproteobacteria bacterium]